MILTQSPSKTIPASLRTLPMFSEHETMSHNVFPASWQPTIKAYPRHHPMNSRPKSLGSIMFAREKLATRNLPFYNKNPSPGQHLGDRSSWLCWKGTLACTGFSPSPLHTICLDIVGVCIFLSLSIISISFLEALLLAFCRSLEVDLHDLPSTVVSLLDSCTYRPT